MIESPNLSENKEKSLRELVEQYTRFWYLFMLGVIIAVVAAFIYLRYSTPLYLSKATVIVKDEKSGGGPAELAAFSDYGGFFSKFNSSNIENELAIFKSKRIITEVVKELNFNITYESIGTIKTSDIYDYRPFTVQYLSFTDEDENRSVPKLLFEIISETEYMITNDNAALKGTYKFGNPVSLPFGTITVIPEMRDIDKFKEYFGRALSVSYRPVEAVAISYQNRINVANELRNSNVVTLTMQSPVREKAEDFINELIFQYNKDAINDRNQVAQKTSNFIDSRLEIITEELDSVERNKEQFKSRNRLTNIEAEAQLILENSSEFNKRQLDIGTQLELANSMINYMENASDDELLPANIGIESEEIASSVSSYNQLVLERNRLLKNSTMKNPVVVNLNNQIEQMRTGVRSALENISNSLKVSMRDLNYQESILNSKISKVPTQEKLYRGIERQQSIKEQLYLFLLQQREEASISLAVTAPKAKIVDNAYSSKTPVSPNKMLIYLGALVAGLLIPFLIIYVSFLLNSKVSNRRDVERVLGTIPIVGEIPKLKRGDEELIQHNDRSVLAEAFRILRTNLQYLTLNTKGETRKSNVIFVTSTIKGEGKTFVAFNLALTLALTGKRVVLVGGDIRNPQLHRYLPDQSKSQQGLTEFIIDESLTATSLATPSEYNKNLSIILSGVIPPNPAELLLQDRTKQFFDELNESFDYVIVDTAPSMLVTDTILINKFADNLLYVVRAGYTDKRLLEFPKDAIEDGRLSEVAIVLNNVSMNNFGYGNKYGYAYSEDRLPWYKRIFS
jgi:tyrosine-protein kinase Etk/Wzc